MKRVVFKTGAAVANFSGAMEADTIQKHGRSSKSQKSRGNILRRACFGLLTAGIILLSINACTGGGSAHAATSSDGSARTEQWEYKHIVQSNNEIDNEIKTAPHKLNNLGKEGWELVSSKDIDNSRGFMFTFKRRLP